jgi:rubrerythrin
LTHVDYAKYARLIAESEKNAAKELVKILEQIEEVNSTAKDKLKDLTKTEDKKK